MTRSTVLRIASAVALAGASVVVTAPGAHAAGPGWYSAAPFAINSANCSGWATMAVGGDRKPMKARSCVVAIRNGVAQGVTIFANESRSSATATAMNAILDKDGYGIGAEYWCGGKTLPAYGRLYCVGTTATFTGEGAMNYSEAYANRYGISQTSPVIYYFV